MSMVTLVSGGLDSSLIAVMAKEAGVRQFPLFINYGQLCVARELEACRIVMKTHGIVAPTVMDLHGFGETIPSGLTDRRRRICEDAFLPGRNAILITAAASYAYSVAAKSVAVGFLDERVRLFPDQSSKFLAALEESLTEALGRRIRLLAPLMQMSKIDVLQLAEQRGIIRTYSCHLGEAQPCGACVSCRERDGAEAERRE